MQKLVRIACLLLLIGGGLSDRIEAQTAYQFTTNASQAGMIFQAAPTGADEPLQLFATSIAAESKAICPEPLQWQVLPVVGTGWLRLSFATASSAEMLALQSWLAEAPTDQAVAPATAPGAWLWQSWLAMADALAALQPARGTPKVLEFRVHLVPTSCSSYIPLETTPEQARTHLLFPVAAAGPVLLNSFLWPTELLRIVQTTAHEAAHMLQLHPFTPERLAESRNGRLIETPAMQHGAYLVDMELDALFVQACLTQAVMPPPRPLQTEALVWRDRRDRLRDVLRDGMSRSTHSDFFQAMERALGPNFPGPLDDDQLGKLMGWCAMVLQRDQAGKSGRPSAPEMAAGQAALKAARAHVHRPLRITYLPYGSQRLGAAEVPGTP